MALVSAGTVDGALAAVAPLPVVALYEVAIAWPPRAGSVTVIPVATATVTIT